MNFVRDLEFGHGGLPRVARRGRPLTILVTGGAGFLGSQLCRHLLHQGHSIHCIDNLMSGNMDNIREFLPLDRFTFRKHDIIDPLEISYPIDRIYNLACPASPPLYQEDPVHTFKTCVIGGLNMLTLAKAKGARILQASTSEVYGDPSISPQSEDYLGNVNTCGPRACYDEGKRGTETLFHDFHDRYGVDIRIARIFNTYGPNMDPEDGRVISNFIVQAITSQDITVMGDGSQTRSFCYRDDLIEGLVRFMEHPHALPKPINFGRPDEYSVLDIAHKVIEMTGSDSKIVFRDLPVDDPRQRRPDISRAKSILGWAPQISLDDGLSRTISYFRGAKLAAEASIRAGAKTV